MPSADGTVVYPLKTGAEGLAGRRWPDAGPSRIPNWVYTDPEIFAREQERIFAGVGWLYVCLDAEIPKPGDFKRSRLGTREVVAVRDPSGEVNVLLNRCAHRSAQFCSATRGTAKEFVCPYHQWTYDLDGSLIRPRHADPELDKTQWAKTRPLRERQRLYLRLRRAGRAKLRAFPRPGGALPRAPPAGRG